MRAVMVATALTLAGCGGGDAGTEAANASAQAGRAPAAGGGEPIVMEPGRWRVAVDVRSIDMPGMPEAVQGQVRESMKAQASTTQTYCVSPEEARRPAGELFAGQPRGACRTNRLSQAGGRVSGELDCEQQGVRTRVSLDGTASPTRYDMNVSSNMDMSGMSVAVTARGRGERIGACAPGEK